LVKFENTSLLRRHRGSLRTNDPTAACRRKRSENPILNCPHPTLLAFHTLAIKILLGAMVLAFHTLARTPYTTTVQLSVGVTCPQPIVNCHCETEFLRPFLIVRP
jgi:hypothetical protein